MLRRTFLPGLVSGTLLGVTLIGHGPVAPLHWAIFFGFVPLWNFWLRDANEREILLSGWVCQFAFNLVAFHWVAYTVNEFSHLGLPLSVLVMLLYCALANLQFPAAGWIWSKFFRQRLESEGLRIAALAMVMAACQRLGTTIFHWNFGYAWLYMGWPGAQVADVAGFRFLCTLTLAFNGLLLAAWLRRRNSASLRPLGMAVAAFALVNFVGAWRLRSLPPPDAKARVLLVQPGVSNQEKERVDKDNAYRERVLEKTMALTDHALAATKPAPDFVVWPENAFPGIIADRAMTFELSAKLKLFVQSRGVNLVTGGFGVRQSAYDPKNVAMTNSLYAIH